MAASISAPGKRAHTLPALDRSQTSDYHEAATFLPASPSQEIFSTCASEGPLSVLWWWQQGAGPATDGMRRDDAEKEEQVAANTLPKILCPQQLQM